jgi:hypothetical protein
MRVVVPVSDLVLYLKTHTLLHVHHKIDVCTRGYLRHNCPSTFLSDILDIDGISNDVIVTYIRFSTSHEALDTVTTFATVYE